MTKKRYSKQPLRDRYLKSHPKICTSCGFPGYVELHHIIPVIEGGNDTDENLKLLCEVCHDKAHGKFNRKNFFDPARKLWKPKL